VLVESRRWAAASSALAQIAATTAGMLPWWALPITLAVTAFVARQPSTFNRSRARASRGVAVAAVAAFAAVIVTKSVGAGSVGADPMATLRSLTEALVVLSLIIAPSSRSPREYRVWLTVTTGVLVAAAAGGRTVTSTVLSALSWIVLLTAISRVQVAAECDGAVPAVGVDRADVGRGSQRMTSAIAPVIASLAAAGVVFFALPAGLGGGDLARTIAHHVQGTLNASATTRSLVGIDTFGEGSLSLLVRGDLATTPILWVPETSPPLWRGTIYRTYTGTGWQDDPIEGIAAVPGPDASVPRLAADPPSGRTETDRVRVAPGAHASLIWAPGVPVHLDGPPNEIVRVIRSSANTRVFGVQPLQTYQVTSKVPTEDPRQLRHASGADPAGRAWTQLPAELPANVSALARAITRHARSRYAQVTDLETYLRSHETYSLNSPVPGPGQDAVEDFLFRDHTGFCEQFASAEAVMLRSLGVPARVVTGLAYGALAGHTRIYTEADAHAWVEVYYPGVGWSPTDPTAGAALATGSGGSRSLLDRAAHAVITDLPGGRVVLVALTTALVLAGGTLVGRYRRRRRGEGRGSDVRRVGPVLTAFHRLTRDRHGPAPRAPSETAREYLGRVAPYGTASEALETLEQECYGASAPTRRETDDAVDAFASLISRR